MSPSDRLQARLLTLSAAFVFLYAAALTLAPAARARSWAVSYRWEHWLGALAWGALFALAHRQTQRYLPERDPYLLPIAALLTGWGLLTIWRLDPGFGFRQTAWLAVAMLALTRGLRLPTDLRFLRRYKYVWLTGGLLLTALTLVFGTNPLGYGPRLWIGCCGVYLQPSEPLKLLLILYLAAYLERFTPARGGRIGGAAARQPLLPLLAPTLIATGLALLLLLVQRDLGTASLFLFLYAAVVYTATGRWQIIAAGALALGIGGAVGYGLFDVVQVRLDAWLNPWADPSGRSYQIVQSLLAIANGGLIGRGAGMGSPGLVPVAHSDFIFAAIAEESGLAGIIGLLALYALLAGRGLRAAILAGGPYRRYAAAGLSAYLAAQAVLIIGGNLRLLPLTGVTLPFVSYGGSSLLTTFMALLLLLHISQRAATPMPGLAAAADTRPLQRLGVFLLAGLAAAGLISGWWAVGRGPALLTRTDNPRRALADRFVRRGALLDRNNRPLAESTGQVGSYTRTVIYPQLSPVIGYTHPTYGQAGLEASLDDYLRGLRGNPGLLIWRDHLLYGQPPPGLDVRLSLALDLQQTADALMAGQRGAAVLLNAQTGEVLAMASHPGFDANTLDEQGETLIRDAASPLLNRAVQGAYPIGSAIGPLLLAEAAGRGNLPLPPSAEACPLAGEADWGAQVAAGCVETVLALRELIPAQADLLSRLGLDGTRASPLQMAQSAAALSAGGYRPAAVMALAVKTPQSGWVLLPSEQAIPALSAEGAQAAARLLAQPDFPLWQSAVVARDESGQAATWYLGGSLPDWQGAPLAVVILLEADQPALAVEIGQALLKSALQP